eukprot:CAMPEP_0184863316 /NCGR_PEP_ID=MMETSP0580-20130426/10505_1 /TAXON_ID=1118495 /ORGANISM="Dactyliosolen fragilissimus" /LENGTH=410 /DNA_ID=CAMNT_0027361585 /DNA_START=119 /DNA_END=1348 /DNA_ORIENTATION=+
MIRITFITGAGKLGRQRYDDGAAKAVTSTLRELGYEEDRGASCVVECGGSFKLQHDTGKNLKTVVVFPTITGQSVEEEEAAAYTNGGGGSSHRMGDTQTNRGKGNGKGPSSLLTEGSPEQLMAESSKDVFTRMIGSKCPSWSQKRKCLTILQELKELLQSLDAKLFKGMPFTDAEQTFYDEVSIHGLNEKESFVKAEMQRMVEVEKKLVSDEKEILLHQVGERIQNLQTDISSAIEEKKPKKADKLRMQLEKAHARETLLKDIVPTPPHGLRFESEIRKLRQEMRPLLQLEHETKGRLLSLKETTILSRKDEIEDEIQVLEEKSRGWFEEDEAFQQRVDLSRSTYAAAAAAKTNKKTMKKKSTTNDNKNGFQTKPVTKWVTPGTTSMKRPVKKTSAQKTSKGNMFAAMML